MTAAKLRPWVGGSWPFRAIVTPLMFAWNVISDAVADYRDLATTHFWFELYSANALANVLVVVFVQSWESLVRWECDCSVRCTQIWQGTTDRLRLGGSWAFVVATLLQAHYIGAVWSVNGITSHLFMDYGLVSAVDVNVAKGQVATT